MSKPLIKFKQSFEKLFVHFVKLKLKLTESHLDLMLKIEGDYDFSEPCWNTLSNQILNEFKAYAIIFELTQKLLPILLPGLDLKRVTRVASEFSVVQAQRELSNQLQDVLRNPPKITPFQLLMLIESVKEHTETTLQEAKKNRTSSELILNFLKTCMNFLITLVTFGTEQSFFKTSIHYLERIKKAQIEIHTLFEKMGEEEKHAELDPQSLIFMHGNMGTMPRMF